MKAIQTKIINVRAYTLDSQNVLEMQSVVISPRALSTYEIRSHAPKAFWVEVGHSVFNVKRKEWTYPVKTKRLMDGV